MHHLDELILRNAVKQLEKALAEMKVGGFKAEILAAMSVSFAISDIKSVLGAPLKETA